MQYCVIIDFIYAGIVNIKYFKNMNATKIEEGNELIKQAEKSMKTSLLKWRPDYDVAADFYNKAATAFRIGKSYDQSKECFLKAADCHKNNNSWFHAAKCYEQIILICKETKQLLEVEEYANRASHLYQQHGSPESAASVLDKAAKVIEAQHPEISLRFYQRAMEISMIEDSTRTAAEYASKVSRIFVKLQMYDQAADALRREIGLLQQTESYDQIGRLAVVLVMVYLAIGDQVAAEKAYKEWGNCCANQEVQTLEMLLQAYDDEDPDSAQAALKSPFIRHMDVEYAKLSLLIPLPQGILSSSKTNVAKNAGASSMSPNSENTGGGNATGTDLKNDDGEEGGLC